MTHAALPPRRIALITGAAGGMGRVCAARLADHYALALSEFRDGPLQELAQALRDQGAEIATTQAGDLGSPQVLAPLLDACSGRLGAVIHTAGLSSSAPDWQTIIRTNLITTARLLDALEPQVAPGMVVILISSMARLAIDPPSGEMLAALEQPLAGDFLDRLEPLLSSDKDQNRGEAYCWSKWWVTREAQRRGQAWGPKGARVMSVSPGMIYTPMGREAVEVGGSERLLDATPLRRWGTTGDIANAVEFILSDKASFLTASDILVDGGMGAGIRDMVRG